MMIDRVSKIIRSECDLRRDVCIVVGVSGGADSLCLLDLFHRLDYPVVIAHLNHGIRDEAIRDESAVQAVADKLDIPLIIGTTSTPDYAARNNLSLEEAARILRYEFLFEQARKNKCQAVAVAHNADDQVETILMNLIRGAGLEGLSAMEYRSVPNPWSETIPLVRPLLSTWRNEIINYCQVGGLDPVLDLTNLDTRHIRNRVRHELIPNLDTYVPGVKNRLWQTADIINAEVALLTKLTSAVWDSVLEFAGSGYLAFNNRQFKLQPLAIQRRIVRRAASELNPDARDIDFAFVKRVLEFRQNPTSSGTADVGLGLRTYLEGDHFYLAEWDTDLPLTHWPQIFREVAVSVPGDYVLNSGWTMQVEVFDGREMDNQIAFQNQDSDSAWLELGEKFPHIKLRGRQPGERFSPLGMNGKSMKLSDYMVNQKIPRRARDHWPLVCIGGEIAWVVRHHLAHPFRITKATKQILHLKLIKSEDKPRGN